MQQINVSDAQNHFNFTLQIWKNGEIFTPFQGRISNLNQSRKSKMSKHALTFHRQVTFPGVFLNSICVSLQNAK